MIGADPTARFVTVECADDYYESLDMATALHPQTLLCYEMYDQPLTREHGAPLRLHIPTKIGYKHAKYFTDLKVSHVLESRLLGRSGVLVDSSACSPEADDDNLSDRNRDVQDRRSPRGSVRTSLVVRLSHWVNAVSLFVMVGSGLQIFRAFPSFGAKIPQKDLLNWPKAFALGGWLGGALQWHLTFMWIYIATGLVYLGYQIFSGNYRQVLFVRGTLRCLADGAPLLLLSAQTVGSLQPVAEARVHLRGRPGSALGADRTRDLEASSVFVAGVDDGRLPSGAVVAFPIMWATVLRVRTSGHGGAAWLE